MIEKLSNTFLKVGKHPLKICFQNKSQQQNDKHDDTTVCFCCQTYSPLYNKLWPVIFLFSAVTDFPMPLPKGKKPGQHRDWGWLPILIVSCFVVYIYYGYLDRIVLVLLRKLELETQAIVYLVFFNLFFVFFVVTYARIVSTKPGNPIKVWKDASFEEANLKSTEQDIKTSLQIPDSILRNPRWCSTCQLWKPDRTHHCRVCNACVLKMDHHCPWVNGCVGSFNYRYYIQFLIYVTLFAAWTFSTSLAVFIQYHGFSEFDSIALSIVVLSGTVLLLVGPFTLAHIWLVLINRTTIENTQFQSWNKDRKKGQRSKPVEGFTQHGKNVFNHGWRDNWLEVMSSNIILWFLPLSLKGNNTMDGIHHKYNAIILEEYLNEDKANLCNTV